MVNYVIEHGEMSRESAEAYFNLKNYILQSVMGTLIMGIVSSAIVAFFTKKKALNNN